MSNIYIQEPPALGKVLLKTSVGDIDLELWTKEAPKACRNFIQLCMEGYYNGTIFHRVVPDFIVQGGDPKGDGTGGESVFGGTFKDEFHSRLRFNRRGLVAMANAGKDDNGSQFFFTLNATPELQNKHTIFAKVTGETVFNMIKLAEGLTDQDDRPLYPHKIISSQVLVDPFGDIVPRVSDKTKDSEEGGKKKKKRDKTGVKNFGLLSFGVEAEEEEDQSTEFRGKPKSTHDVLDDPKLSRLTALEVENDDEGASSSSKVMDEATVAAVNSIRDKLQAKSKGDPKRGSREIDRKTQDKLEEKSDEEEVEEYYLGKDKIEARKKQAEEIRGQIRDLKREMSGKKASDIEAAKVAEEKADEKKPDNELIQDFEQQQEKYKKMKEDVPTKGVSREQFTLALLSKFQKKLSSMKEKVHEEKEVDEESVTKKSKAPVDDLEAINSDDWLTHELRFENHGQVLAKDASTKGDDWFDIYDPRNPLNKRKREQSSKAGPQSSKTQKKI